MFLKTVFLVLMIVFAVASIKLQEHKTKTHLTEDDEDDAEKFLVNFRKSDIEDKN